MPGEGFAALSAAADRTRASAGFKIAEGFIEVDTRFDDNRLQRTVKRSFDRLDRLSRGALGRLGGVVTGIASTVFETANKLAGQAAQSVLQLGTSLTTAAVSGTAMTASTGGLNIVIGALVAGILALVGAVAAATVGFVALAPLLLVVGGSVGALVTAMSGLVATGFVLKMGLTGISDALGELADEGKISDETLKKLSPNARKLVGVLWELRKPLAELRKFVQDRLLQGMNKEIKELANQWLPSLEPMLGGLAGDLNDLGKQFINAFSKRSFIRDMMEAVTGFGDMLRDIGRSAVPDLVKALGNLAMRSVPFLQAIGEMIIDIVDGFSDWINRAEKSGALKSFMAEAVRVLQQMSSIGKSAFSIMGSLITLLFPPSNKISKGVLGSIDEWLGRVAAWLAKPENQEKIRQWVRDAIAKITEFVNKVKNEWIPEAQRWMTRIEGWLATIDKWVGRIEALGRAVGRVWAAIRGVWNGGLAFVSTVVGLLTGQTDLVARGHATMRDKIGARFEDIRRAGTGFVTHMLGKVFGPLRVAIGTQVPGSFATGSALASTRFNDMRNRLSATWTGIRTGILDPLMARVRTNLPSAFSAGVNAISNAWKRLEGIASRPVEFVVNTVIQRGLVDNFNRIAGIFPGAPKLPNVSFKGRGDGPGVGDGLGDALANPAKWVSGKIGLERITERFGSGGFAKLLMAMGNRLKSGAIDKLKSLFSLIEHMGPGGSGSAAGLQGPIAGLLAMMRKLFPGLRLISGLRPGAVTLSGRRSYHALGRAIDLPAIRAVAVMIKTVFGRIIKELITPWRDLNMLNGRPHRFSYAVEAQHGVFGKNAHIHAALDDGEVRVLRPGVNVIPNGTGKLEPIFGPVALAKLLARIARGDTFVIQAGAIQIDVSRIADLVKFADMLRGLKSTSRQFAISGVSGP